LLDSKSQRQLLDHLRYEPFIFVAQLLYLLLRGPMEVQRLGHLPFELVDLRFVGERHPLDVLLLLLDDPVPIVELSCIAGVQLLELDLQSVDLELQALVAVLQVGDFVLILPQ